MATTKKTAGKKRAVTKQAVKNTARAAKPATSAPKPASPAAASAAPKSATPVTKPAAAASSTKKAAPRKKSAKTTTERGKAVGKTVTAEQRWRMISETAYYIAESRGFVGGDTSADWLEAEARIDQILRSEKTTVSG